MTDFGTIDPSIIALINASNTFGAFDQIIPTSNLKLSQGSFKGTFVVATLAADRTWTMPDSTGTIQTQGNTATFSNKNITLANNTVTDTSRATGDLMKDNGTKYARFGIGTPLQLLRVNSGGTDLEWGSVSDTMLSANIPLINAANVYTAQQKISVDNGQQIIFYRPVNTGGFGAGFYYNFNNSSSAEVTYGNQYASIEDNTAGAHRGDFNVQLAIAASLGIRFRVYTAGNGGLLFGNNQRIQIDEGGLTAPRIYTLPDVTTKLMGENTLVVQNPVIKRTGTYMPTTPTTASATTVGALDGILQQHVPTGPGTNTNTFDTTEGLLTNLVTTTTQNQNAGLVSPTGALGVGRRLFGMKAVLRSKIDTVAGGVSRLYFGFTSATAIPTSDTPIANADSGIIVGFTSADTNYQIRSNDGTGAATVTAITGNIAKNTNFHTIEISWTASGNIIVTFDGTAQTISTDLPLTTADLKFHCVAQNATAAIRTHSIKGVWLEADK